MVPGSVPLLQERLGRRDPWRVAIVCACLNRARGRQAEPVLRDMFRRWPNASRMHMALDRGFMDAYAYRNAATRKALLDLLRPLGLAHGRAGAVERITLNVRAQRRVTFVGRGPFEARRAVVDALGQVKGVGPYAVASMRAFCLGDLSVAFGDKELRPRIAFLCAASCPRRREGTWCAFCRAARRVTCPPEPREETK